jgi:hypothetical protein
VNSHTAPSRRRREPAADAVAGFLEVGRKNGCGKIVIKHPARKADSRGLSYIVLSPRHARHLASLLILNAEEAEADTGGNYPTKGIRDD